MADLDDDWDEDSGVYGAILDLNMGAVAKLECDWVGGPHAADVQHARANLAACRAAVEKISTLLDVAAKRSQSIPAKEGEAAND